MKWMNPMLATLTREHFSDPHWIYEPKLDGIRCLAYRDRKNVQLYSRNELSLNDTFAELIAPLLKQKSQNFILDGEAVAMEGEVSRFATLQRRGQERIVIFYYVFDILYLDGNKLTRLPLLERKEILRKAFTWKDPLRFVDYRVGEGEKFYRQACRQGWEGIIAKRADSVYAGERSKDWLKFKCENEQEFVIVGYTDPMGQREGIGALLVGVYQRGKLKYAGKVGTGFDTKTLRDLQKKLSAIERMTTSCSADSLPRTRVHWVEPRLVAQVAFTEWTEAGKLRHPRFVGLRFDKKASDVVRE
jgi:bifunctional non-homologous end joining protein LigD